MAKTKKTTDASKILHHWNEQAKAKRVIRKLRRERKKVLVNDFNAPNAYVGGCIRHIDIAIDFIEKEFDL